MILSVITKKDEISISERRHLANMPKFTLEGILDKNNSYSNKLSDYLMDHFIGRETFKKIKSFLIELITKNPDDGEYAIDLLMMAKYFERIGDHALNIADEWQAIAGFEPNL